MNHKIDIIIKRNYNNENHKGILKNKEDLKEKEFIY